MSGTQIIHTFINIVATIAPAYWIYSPLLQNYTLQACGAAVILYIVSKKVLPPTSQDITTVVFLNLIIQLLVFSTGASLSPLFFLYYFVLFAFAIYFDRTQVFLISLITTLTHLYFSRSAQIGPNQIANLLSILLISPLASIYSQAVLKNELSKQKIKNLENDLSETEADSLLWITTENKPTLNKAIDSITDLIIYLKSTRSKFSAPNSFVAKLKAIQSDLLTLYSSADLLEDNLKNQTDNNKK